MTLKNGWLKKTRSSQNVFWMHQKIEDDIKNHFYET